MSVNITGFSGISPNITYLSQCTPSLCSLNYAEVRYVPTFAGNAFYLSIFAIFLVTQLISCFFYRTYSYTFAMSCGLILEIIGYAGRLGMHNNPFLSNPFLINIICLTIAPVFFTAALYLTLSRLILHYGAHNARLSPRIYTLTFITSDIIALILQASGGGIADTASTRAESQTGVNIMVAGLSFQVISLVCFIVLCAEFFWNVRTDKRILRATDWAAGAIEKREDGMGMRGLILAFTAATLLILVRSIFRVAELAHGFGSRLANDQVPFMILEGGMIILATGLMAGFHPGRYFGDKWGESGWKIGRKSRGEEVKIMLMDNTWSNDVYLRPLPLAR